MGIFSFFNKKNKNDKTESSSALPETPKTKKAKVLIEELEQLGYFKYADPVVTEAMKIDAAKMILDGVLPYIYQEEPPYRFLDLRYFRLDGEDLFEQDGVINHLKEMQPAFQKMGVEMNISEHLEEWDEENDWLNHEICINKKKYILFHHFGGYGWGEAAQRFADMVNDQLELQGSSERLYLTGGGNDGNSILLNDQLYKLFRTHITHESSRPMTVEEWCPLMDVIRVPVF